MVNKFSALLRQANFALLPGTCLLCRRASHRTRDLCIECEQALPWLGNHCELCAQPLPFSNRCGECLKKPPAFDSCVSAFEYKFPINQLVTGFKYNRKLEYGQLLAALWLDYCRPSSQQLPDLIVPVPLHWRRAFTRSFNQAELLSRQLANELGLDSCNVVCRHRATAKQQGLSAAARRKNLKHAFSITQNIEGLHLAIVDDVVTTGSTAEQLALQCKREGARRVDIWSMARTP